MEVEPPLFFQLMLPDSGVLSVRVDSIIAIEQVLGIAEGRNEFRTVVHLISGARFETRHDAGEVRDKIHHYRRV